MLASRPMIPTTRREFLRIGLVGSVASLTGRVDQAHAGARSLIVRRARPQDLEPPVPSLVDEYTPNDVFIVRSHFGPPVIDDATWNLQIEGMVQKPGDLSMDQLHQLRNAKAPAVLQCAGNGRALFRPKLAGAQWERGAVGHALWRGVRLSDVLEHVGVDAGARFVTFLHGDHTMTDAVLKFLLSLTNSKDPQE